MDNCEKVSKAAEKCLAYAISQTQQFTRVAEVMALMRKEPGWTDSEVIEVQSRVIRALMSRLDCD